MESLILAQDKLVLDFMTLRNLEALDSISVERAETVEIVHDAVALYA